MNSALMLFLIVCANHSSFDIVPLKTNLKEYEKCIILINLPRSSADELYWKIFANDSKIEYCSGILSSTPTSVSSDFSFSSSGVYNLVAYTYNRNNVPIRCTTNSVIVNPLKKDVTDTTYGIIIGVCTAIIIFLFQTIITYLLGLLKETRKFAFTLSLFLYSIKPKIKAMERPIAIPDWLNLQFFPKWADAQYNYEISKVIEKLFLFLDDWNSEKIGNRTTGLSRIKEIEEHLNFIL